MRKISCLLLLSSCFLALAGALQAQQVDAQFGLNGIHGTSATNFDPTNLDHNPVSLSGGVYPSVAADVILLHNLGFNGEVSWRATRGVYLGQADYRPILYDFNAVYARKVTRVGFALMAGIGAESTRFYVSSNSGCNPSFQQCFISSNHFLGHLGGALRLYVTPSVYVAPELHYYFVHNNVEFTGVGATRYGVNIGYTFGK